MTKKIPIITNVYDIPQRLREIDKDYFVLFNCDSGKFEIHHKEQKHNTLSLILPYDELDSRAIDMVLQTRIENLDRLIKEIDLHNEMIGKEAMRKQLNEASEKTREIADYVKNKEDKDWIDDKAYSTKFI